MKKSELRRSLLRQRQSLSLEEWRHKSDRICFHLQAFSLFLQAKTILAYFSFRQEPDLNPLFTSERNWGFPRCIGQSLAWHLWSPAEPLPLQSGAYGILEPHPNAPVLGPDAVDLILVPAVACDRQGYRLGYGGGFYDRLLSSPDWANKPTLGIVFEETRLTALPYEPWDQPLKGICTEAGVFPCKS